VVNKKGRERPEKARAGLSAGSADSSEVSSQEPRVCAEIAPIKAARFGAAPARRHPQSAAPGDVDDRARAI
jgi:hypothetical protein